MIEFPSLSYTEYNTSSFYMWCDIQKKIAKADIHANEVNNELKQICAWIRTSIQVQLQSGEGNLISE